MHCSSVCKKGVEHEARKLVVVLASFCPVHLLLHAKTLQARDVGVTVNRLRGPVFGKYRMVKDVPSGATLVARKRSSTPLHYPLKKPLRLVSSLVLNGWTKYSRGSARLLHETDNDEQ